MKKPVESNNSSIFQANPFIANFTFEKLDTFASANGVFVNLHIKKEGSEKPLKTTFMYVKNEEGSYNDLAVKLITLADGFGCNQTEKETILAPENTSELEEVLVIVNNLLAGKSAFVKVSGSSYEKNGKISFNYQISKKGFISQNKDTLKITDYDKPKHKVNPDEQITSPELPVTKANDDDLPF